jgi:hypothetical protein
LDGISTIVSSEKIRTHIMADDPKLPFARGTILMAVDILSRKMTHAGFDRWLLELGLEGLSAGRDLGGLRARGNAVAKFALDYPEKETAEGLLVSEAIVRQAERELERSGHIEPGTIEDRFLEAVTRPDASNERASPDSALPGIRAFERRVVPSDVVRQIQRLFPGIQPGVRQRFFIAHSTHFRSILRMLDSIPGKLIVLPSSEFAELQTAAETMRNQIDWWQKHGDQACDSTPGSPGQDPVTLILSLLSKCSDDAPATQTLAAPKTAAPIADSELVSVERDKFVALEREMPRPRKFERRVFIVHGHDDGLRESVARFLERIGFEVIILHEQANKGRTLIEKFERHGDVGYVVVLLTPDDFGGKVGDTSTSRARQNVLLEWGYFIGRVGRERVCALMKGEVELPSDVVGIVWERFDELGHWQRKLAKELENAGFSIDWKTAMS